MTFDPNRPATGPGAPTTRPAGGSVPAAPPADAPAPTGPAATGPAGTQPAKPSTPPRRATPGLDSKGHVRRTRVSGVWVGMIAGAVFLILLVIFIAQNSRDVSLHFFGWHGQFSLALTILISAAFGVLVVAIPGSVRIFQLRRSLRKNAPSRK